MSSKLAKEIIVMDSQFIMDVLIAWSEQKLLGSSNFLRYTLPSPPNKVISEIMFNALMMQQTFI